MAHVVGLRVREPPRRALLGPEQAQQRPVGIEGTGGPEQFVRLQGQAHPQAIGGQGDDLFELGGRLRHPGAVVAGQAGLQQEWQGLERVALAESGEELQAQGIELGGGQGALAQQSLMLQLHHQWRAADDQVGASTEAGPGTHALHQIPLAEEADMQAGARMDPHVLRGQLVGQFLQAGAHHLVIAGAGGNRHLDAFGGLDRCRQAALAAATQQGSSQAQPDANTAAAAQLPEKSETHGRIVLSRPSPGR